MSSSTYSVPAPDELGASRHPAVGAWFFGPRAENFDHLARSFETILGNQREARQTTYPDSDFITEDIKASNLYTEQIARLDENLGWVTKTLSKTSVPFWSPRYNAHMAIESSMPAVVGCTFHLAKHRWSSMRAVWRVRLTYSAHIAPSPLACESRTPTDRCHRSRWYVT